MTLHPIYILFYRCNQITKGHFSHFRMSNLQIKFFMKMEKEDTEVEEEFVLIS